MFGVLYEEWINWLKGKEPSCQGWSSISLRFLFINAFGFSNRKLSLTFQFKPEKNMEECLTNTANWFRINMEENERLYDFPKTIGATRAKG